MYLFSRISHLGCQIQFSWQTVFFLLPFSSFPFPSLLPSHSGKGLINPRIEGGKGVKKEKARRGEEEDTKLKGETRFRNFKMQTFFTLRVYS